MFDLTDSHILFKNWNQEQKEQQSTIQWSWAHPHIERLFGKLKDDIIVQGNSKLIFNIPENFVGNLEIDHKCLNGSIRKFQGNLVIVEEKNEHIKLWYFGNLMAKKLVFIT